MKILHTSDWHLGRTLYGRKRYAEFAAFLDWLSQILIDQEIDLLLVAGDIFDSPTPSNQAQTLYYQFLCRVAASGCQHIVIIAGNHDSPSFLNAPKALLKTLNVHVIGAATDNPDDEVLVLPETKNAQVIVCAVPYLRDKDIRSLTPGETIDEKNRKLAEGLQNHYREIVARAEKMRAEITASGKSVPILAMGHLFASGGKTVDGDGVRELYVGSLAHIGTNAFPTAIDYLALGHLHVPQTVGGHPHIRYSGSPIAMGFGEATQQKSVVIFRFKNNKPSIALLPVPVFQPLARIRGSLENILAQLDTLKAEQSATWLEIDYTGNQIIPNLREKLDDAIAGSALEILRIKNRQVMDQILGQTKTQETLDDLDPEEVFTRCLNAYNIPENERDELTSGYREILQDLLEDNENR